ncbi:MAG: hypothetical protein AB7P40_00275 [Chloroflexota bacterium]
MPSIILLPDPSVAASTGRVAWVDPDNVAHSLDDGETIRYTRGSVGLGLPPLDIVRSEVPYQPGSRVRRVRTTERELTLPFLLQADAYADLRTQKQVMQRYLWSSDAEGDDVRYGYLRFTLVTGDTRQIRALYLEGLEGDTSQQYVTWEDIALTFLCPDGWFEDISDTVVTFTKGAAAVTWFGRPWFPFTLLGSTLIDSVSVDNTGDLEAWPIWTLTGPANSPVFRNLTTGAILSIPYNVPAGGTLTIDTRPGYRRVVDQTGNSRYGVIPAGSTLWSLARGLNQISVSAGSTTTATALTMNYRRRYLSA